LFNRRIPFNGQHILDIDVDWGAANDNKAFELVARAADGLLSAGVASEANGVAVKANLASNVAQVKANETSKEGSLLAVSVLDRVAARVGASVALASARNNESGGAGGEEAEQRERGDASEHLWIVIVNWESLVRSV